MNKNEMMKKHLDSLKIQMEQGQSLIELISCCYFAYQYKTEKEVYGNISFSDFNSFRTTALALCNSLPTAQSSLIKDMIVRGFLHCGIQTQRVYEDLCQSELTEIMDCMDTAVQARLTGIQDVSTEQSIASLMVSLSSFRGFGSAVNLCSGEGSLLSHIVKHFPHAEVEGVDVDPVSVLICRMRMNILQSDCRVWQEDLLKTRLNRQYTAVYCHYPWGAKYSKDVVEDNVGWMDYSTVRRGRMDWAFIIKALNCMRPQGHAYILVPNGILSSTVDRESKQRFVDNGFIEKIIELPSILIPGSASGISLLILSDSNTQVDFIDATQCLVKGNRGKELDVQAVMDIVNSEHSSRKITVSTEVIAEHEYLLQYREFRRKPDASGMVNPVPLKQVAEIITGYQYTSETLNELDEGGNLKIVKMGNLDDGKITGELSGCDLDEARVEKYILRENDLLMQNKGSSSKMVLLGQQEEKRIPHSNLTILRCHEELILPEYLYLFLQGGMGEQMLNHLRKGVMRMSNISKSDLEELKVPLVDKEVQKALILRYRELNEMKQEAESRLKMIEQKLSDLVSDEMER